MPKTRISTRRTDDAPGAAPRIVPMSPAEALELRLLEAQMRSHLAAYQQADAVLRTRIEEIGAGKGLDLSPQATGSWRIDTVKGQFVEQSG